MSNASLTTNARKEKFRASKARRKRGLGNWDRPPQATAKERNWKERVTVNARTTEGVSVVPAKQISKLVDLLINIKDKKDEAKIRRTARAITKAFGSMDGDPVRADHVFVAARIGAELALPSWNYAYKAALDSGLRCNRMEWAASEASRVVGLMVEITGD